MELHEFEEKFRHVDHELGKLGEEWAEKKYLWQQLDSHTKPLLAKLRSGFTGSEAARERLALASDEYRDHLLGVAEAELQMNKAKVSYDRMWQRFEAYRSLCSMHKKIANIV